MHASLTPFAEFDSHCQDWGLRWIFKFMSSIIWDRQTDSHTNTSVSLSYFSLLVWFVSIQWWKNSAGLGTEESQHTVFLQREIVRAHESTWICELRVSWCGSLIMGLYCPNTFTLCNSLCNSLCCRPFCIFPSKHVWYSSVLGNGTMWERDEEMSPEQWQLAC